MSDKTPNHFLTDMKCPMSLQDVDLFAPGAQEHWYDAYPILHGESPVHKLAGEGLTAGTDAFILTKHHCQSKKSYNISFIAQIDPAILLRVYFGWA